MTGLIEWLLDLQNIRLGRDAPLILRWSDAVEAWKLLAIGLAAVTLVTLVYRRERVSPARKTVLAALRCGLIALVVAVLCQPSLVLQQDRIEPSHVALLLDTSLSMRTNESYRDETLAEAVARGAGLEDVGELGNYSRLGLVQRALTRDGGAPLRQLLTRNGVQLYTFGSHVETQGFAADPDGTEELAAAVQSVEAWEPGTDLANAIHHVIEKAQGRRLAAVVLASDGQATSPTDLKDTLDQARDRQLPVLPIRIGSTAKLRDSEIVSVRAEESVFVDDIVAVEAQVAARGLAEPTPLEIRLVDNRDDTVLASESLLFDPPSDLATVELRIKPEKTGPASYRVEVSPLPDELTAENNAQRVDIRILDNRLRVLYVEGYPRYEYRYLKNALLREKTVELSVLLLEADEVFVQEGSDPIRRFPETPQELNQYDVVLFGDVDVRAGWLTQAQMDMLLDFVGNEGGGFGMIAGERFAPHRVLGTVLEKLIPVRIDPSFLGRYDRALLSGFHPRLTPEGRQSRVFRFEADRDESQRVFEALPELFWIARTLGEKPGASVLAEHPTLRTTSGPMPLVVTSRYGGGRVFFQATDDTWRWRRHTGELLHDTYWVQVVRELMRSSRVSLDRRFEIRTDRRLYPYGSPVRVQVEVYDSHVLSQLGNNIQLNVRGLDVAPTDLNRTAHDPTLPRGAQTSVSDLVGRFPVLRLAAESSLFEGTWIPPSPGRFAIEVADLPAAARPGEAPPSAQVRVEIPNLEAQAPEADHDVLERIARATGGQVIELDALQEAFGMVRDRSVRVPDDIVEPLWDSRLVLMLFTAMISLEWLLRKLFGLV